MPLFQFSNYLFNTNTLELTRNNLKVKIRPKTALLLRVLIENRHRIISKDDLFAQVWKTEHVQDHTLFQLVSEIRKLIPDSQLILTQPNQGYQWVANITQKNHDPKFTPYAVAISVIGLCFGVFVLNSHPKSTPKSSLIYSLPAMSAYTKGAVALESGNPETAEQWLRFSLKENPNSISTQLLLAESLLIQKNYQQAETLALGLYQDKQISTYDKSAAADLLSRIYQQQGLVNNALQFALDGMNQLDSEQAQCTTGLIKNRIDTLSSLLKGQSKQKFTQAQNTNKYLTSKIAKNAQAHPQSQNVDMQCQQLINAHKGNEVSDCNTIHFTPSIAIRQRFETNKGIS